MIKLGVEPRTSFSKALYYLHVTVFVRGGVNSLLLCTMLAKNCSFPHHDDLGYPHCGSINPMHILHGKDKDRWVQGRLSPWKTCDHAGHDETSSCGEMQTHVEEDDFLVALEARPHYRAAFELLYSPGYGNSGRAGR